MKKLILFVIGILISTFAFSQEMYDAVYLKDGSVIKGVIIEQVPNQNLKIQTNNGSIILIEFSEVEKITKEKKEINLDEYGGKISYGIAIGGGGIVGFNTRKHICPKFAMEFGVFYRPAIVIDPYENSKTFNSVLIAGGSNIYLGKYYKYKKEKIKLNGITIKGGAGFGEFTTCFGGVGWIHESFKKTNKNHSFTLELGPGVIVTSDLPDLYDEYNTSQFALYWKLLWSWYSK